eukprot:1162070-Pelagomonas_calceolata.AAC.15
MDPKCCKTLLSQAASQNNRFSRGLVCGCTTSLTCPLPDCHHMDSALHILSDCQCPVMRNTRTECHNIACRMIFKL